MEENLYCTGTVNNNSKLCEESIKKCGIIAEIDFIDNQINEYKQNKRNVNPIEARRLKKRGYYLKNRASLTEEQRLKTIEDRRERRANLTEEQRWKEREYQRRKRANYSEEQRLRVNEYNRQKRANFTEEQRLKEKEYNRKWRANSTKQQRLKMGEYNCKNVDSTEEQCLNIEKPCKPQANLTEERHLIKYENKRKKHVNLIEKKHSNENKIKYKKSSIITKNQCVKNPKNFCNRNIAHAKERPTTTSLLGNENPLLKLIEQIRNGKEISQIDNNLLIGILQMLGLGYAQNILLQSQNTIQKINYEFDSIFLIEFLKKWEGWIIDDRVTYLSSTKACVDLFDYLCENFLYIKLHRETSLLEEVNNFCPLENYINTSCSLKQLKSLFYHSPHKYTNYYRKNDVIRNSSSRTSSVLNSSRISTHVILPNFSMKHSNVHVDEYHLLDITHEKKSNFNLRKSYDTFSEMNNDIFETYQTEFISKFLSQLKIAITNSDILFYKRVEIIAAIAELEKDIAHCTNVIKTNTTYTINLMQNPYTRYLGYPDDGNMNISIAEQKLLKETTFNVRLQEIRYPRISFKLENFSVPYKLRNDDIHFIFNKSFLTNLNTCLTYRCLLCDVSLGPHASSRRISDHLLQYHGPEPDWECLKCSKSFSDNFLIENRWTHDCQ